MLSRKNGNLPWETSEQSGCHLMNGAGSRTDGPLMNGIHIPELDCPLHPPRAKLRELQTTSKGSLALFLLTVFALYLVIL